jgi:pyruvate/2-oxoglutarate/acetoin dehydrogenase E1 component
MSSPAEVTVATKNTDSSEFTYRDAIRMALEDELEFDPLVILMGEDVANSGGVFKTNEGLPERFGTNRIINTPICENGFLGVALGMAVTGLRPVVEIMFSDFLPTAADAIVNELPKFRFMSAGQAAVPVTIRSIGGGTGRFGTQHSATGESWFLQVLGLKIAAAATPHSAYHLLRASIRDNNPVLFFEHKGLWNRKGTIDRSDAGSAQPSRAAVVREGRDVTVVATMLMVDRAMEAASLLAREGIDVEVVDLQWLNPIDHGTVARSVGKTRRLLIAEEQYHIGGWGATVISVAAQAGLELNIPPAAVSIAEDQLVPFSPELEDQVIPSIERIAVAIRHLVK